MDTSEHAYSPKAIMPRTMAMAASTQLSLIEFSLTPESLSLSAMDAIQSAAVASPASNADVRQPVQYVAAVMTALVV